MRSVFKIINLLCAALIIVNFTLGCFKVVWNNDLFPYVYLILFSLFAVGPLIAVYLSRKSSNYIYGFLTTLNFCSLMLLNYGFFDFVFFERFWQFNFAISLITIWLGVLFYLNRFNSIFIKFVQIAIILNIGYVLFFLVKKEFDGLEYDILLISAFFTFLLALISSSYFYFKSEVTNKDKFQIHGDEEANNLTV